MDDKPKISLIKKTLGKNGRYYHYESLSAVDDPKDVHWYKIDQSYYEFHVKENQENALKVQYNDNKEVVYMEYIAKSYLPKLEENKGCLSVFLLASLFISP